MYLCNNLLSFMPLLLVEVNESDLGFIDYRKN